MTNLKKLPGAIKFALFASAATLVSGNVVAQEAATDDAKTLDRIEVTGSRLKRADIEGAVPVVVIDRAQIDASGDVSVADVLRDSTFSSFGNFRPQSGSSAQALADIDLRGLGSSRTLVLIDGRRAPKAPFSGQSADLNAVPIAAVERIEILSDGASAVYGSDAIGGVVNIILRKDFNGAELRIGTGQTKIQGGDTQEGSAIMGVSSDRGSLIAGLSYSKRGMVFTKDQIGGGTLGVSSFGNNYRTVVPNPDRADPTTPPRPDFAADWRATGAFIRMPGFACDTNGFWVTPGNTCSFDFNSVAANEASIENKSLFARGDYQINDDWTLYMTATASRVNSFGRYAPTPGEVFIPSGSPNDPTPADGLPAFVRHRFAAAGNRDTSTDATVTDLLIGSTGQLTDKVSVDFGLRRNEYHYNELGRGFIVRPLAEQAIANGSYNLLDPFGSDPAVVKGFTATIARESTWKTEELYGTVNFDLFEMGGGVSNAVVGAEYRKEEYADIFDPLSEAGVIEGSAGNSAGGSRDVYSAFFEWLFPFTSTFDVTIAGRYDKYSDYGNDFSPKIAARWQPLDNLTFRASYGEGFRAPTLDILTQQAAFSADPVTDFDTCVVFGGNPATCANTEIQVDATVIANGALKSEQSKQYSIGVAYDPFDWLNVTLDYYNIKVEDRINQFTSQELIDRSIDPSLGPIPAGLGVLRDPITNAIIRVTRGSANEGTLETDGFDFNLRTNFDLGGAGKLENALQVSYINKYDIISVVGDVSNQAGIVGQPDLRAALRNTWSLGDFTVGFSTNYIDGQSDSTGNVGGYATNDVYVNYKTPWKAAITIGANNVGDRYPELVGFNGRPWNFSLYDAYGRTVYFRYTQSF
ncbi:TonB-dependent receptor [Pseudoxanthomonas sp. CF125]|jgi:iron complex outermembrane receptor protein|uniref:TonB-dependent receptor plug domain-containing protein n=1 Tax=Pseudoxanthomonas sp. CF125 TaxID=1855303 RepID=UPI00088EEE22|nr:TonB-dependent receptor [Pseudoxanthomonas sp. CF125]SDQ54250.1 iron complex outermembrane recepter protein [Pseudoxanthomonas sp. CF125]